MCAMSNPQETTSYFNTSSQLSMYWLGHEIIIHDFVPGGEYLVTIFHSHRHMELMYVHGGKGSILIEDQAPVPLQSGDLVYLNAGISHRVDSDTSDPLRTNVVSFSITPFASTEKIAAAWIEDERAIVRATLAAPVMMAKDNGSCRRLLDVIEESVSSRRLGELVIIKNMMSSYVMAALQRFTNLPVRSDFDSVLQSMPMLSASRITQYISNHYMENITINSVAESLFYSPRQCQRIIRDSLGISFSDYLSDIRLTQAKKLLCSTDDSIEKIAELCGFKSGKSLSRLMRQREGITPYRLRKEKRVNGDSP